jgi:5-methyltetrahydrofolate--homocysteine methyltransferase
MADLTQLKEAIIRGKKPLAEELTRKALAEGTSPYTILDEGLVPGMEIVGDKFKINEFYVPEMLVAARAMKAAMAIIRPQMVDPNQPRKARIVIGTVKGDLHDIGKNLVAMMLEGAGFEIVDLGVDVSPQVFVEKAKAENADVICMSALLTTTMSSMQETVKVLKESGMRDSVRVMIGGAPITQKYADQIGADGYSPDAASAVDKARTLVQAA